MEWHLLALVLFGVQYHTDSPAPETLSQRVTGQRIRSPRSKKKGDFVSQPILWGNILTGRRVSMFKVRKGAFVDLFSEFLNLKR